MPGRFEAIIAKSRETNGYYGLWINPQNQWSFTGSDGAIFGGTVTPDWHFVAGVQDGARQERRLYVDGALITTGPSVDGTGPGALLVGGATSVSEFFAGDIDEVRLHRRALSPAEIAYLSQVPARIYAIDAGGNGSGEYSADMFFTRGHSDPITGSVDSSGVDAPAPDAVYLSKRTGGGGVGFSYTLPNLQPGATYSVRLHFLENVATQPGERQFNVSVNGAPVLTNFDVFVAAGGQFKAIAESFVTSADANGNISVSFDYGASGNPLLNGLELFSGSPQSYLRGFANATELALNGTAAIAGGSVRLTAGGSQAGSVFSTQRLDVTRFVTQFQLHIRELTSPGADGMTFTIQGQAPHALGNGGGGLGYGASATGGSGGIPSSAAVKFDLYDNEGEGPNSTGLFTNGGAPTVPAVDLQGTGIDLHGGHPIVVTAAYDGQQLAITLLDTISGAAASEAYTVDLPTIVGGPFAYVGFTAGTGGFSAAHDLVDWTYLSY